MDARLKLDQKCVVRVHERGVWDLGQRRDGVDREFTVLEALQLVDVCDTLVRGDVRVSPLHKENAEDDTSKDDAR